MNGAMKRILLGLVLVIAACGGRGDGTTATTRPAGVPWADYAPTLKSEIDGLATAKDCAQLQVAFDNAEANGDAMRERTGHNNADLMGYIDRAMRGAGCYG